MSTRFSRESAGNRHNELHRLILTRQLNDNDNKVCADCTERMPRWASWSLGVFMCLKCSGVHRSLGVHVSKVKSVNLDTWTREQINHVISRGNKWANAYYRTETILEIKFELVIFNIFFFSTLFLFVRASRRAHLSNLERRKRDATHPIHPK